MTNANPYSGLYHDCTTDHLQRLRREILVEKMQPESLWKELYYAAGLIAIIGATLIIIVGGVARLSAVLLAIGLPAVWLWYKGDRRLKSIDSAYEAVVAELGKRGEN